MAGRPRRSPCFHLRIIFIRHDCSRDGREVLTVFYSRRAFAYIKNLYKFASNKILNSYDERETARREASAPGGTETQEHDPAIVAGFGPAPEHDPGGRVSDEPRY